MTWVNFGSTWVCGLILFDGDIVRWWTGGGVNGSVTRWCCCESERDRGRDKKLFIHLFL